MATQKELLTSAKAYIKANQPDKARNILKGIHHPTAEKWLTQLDRQHPPQPLYRKWWVIALGVVMIVSVMFLAWLLVTVPTSCFAC